MSTIGFKRTLARLWGAGRSNETRRVIVYYHAIGSGPIATSNDSFRRQMQWLATNAEVLSLDALLSGGGKGALQVAITFDDGYASVALNAAPILASLGLPATVYVNTSWMGEMSRRDSAPQLGHYPGEQFMTWSDVDFLTKNNWTIGSHGAEHLDLTAVDDATLALELTSSKQMIETRLGRDCPHFAYTWGRYTRRVQRAVAAAAYKTAVSAVHGPVKAGSDPFALPRLDISNQYSLEDFQAIVRGDWDFLGGIQRVRRVTQGLAWG